MQLKELKNGDYFTKKNIEYPNEKQVFIKSDYDKSTKKYICYRFSDINDYLLIDGKKEIFTDFIF